MSAPDLGGEFNAARELLRATVLELIGDGMHGGDALKCMATAATALLGQVTADRDRLAAEVADRDRLAAEAAVQQTAMVRALGQDIDGLGPPGLGRFYLVLEVPTGPLGDVLTEAVTSGRIGLVRAGS